MRTVTIETTTTTTTITTTTWTTSTLATTTMRATTWTWSWSVPSPAFPSHRPSLWVRGNTLRLYIYQPIFLVASLVLSRLALFILSLHNLKFCFPHFMPQSLLSLPLFLSTTKFPPVHNIFVSGRKRGVMPYLRQYFLR
mgnify:CR=1 FL=1